MSFINVIICYCDQCYHFQYKVTDTSVANSCNVSVTVLIIDICPQLLITSLPVKANFKLS